MILNQDIWVPPQLHRSFWNLEGHFVSITSLDFIKSPELKYPFFSLNLKPEYLTIRFISLKILTLPRAVSTHPWLSQGRVSYKKVKK